MPMPFTNTAPTTRSTCPTAPGPTASSTARRSGARPTCATATRRSSSRWTRAQAEDVRPARRARRQGDRGRLPVGVEDRLRVRPQAGRGRPDPGRHDDRRAHAGAAGADRAHLRGDRGRARGRSCTSTTRPPRRSGGSSSASTRTGSPISPSAGRCSARSSPRRPRPRSSSSTAPRASTAPSSTTRSRSARRRRGVGADDRGEDDRQPADDGRGVPAERLRRPARVVPAPLLLARPDHPQRPPAQRPRHRGGDGRARADGRRRPRRGDAVRERRAHRQRRPRHARAQPADPGRRPGARPLADRRGEADRRGVQRAARPPAPPVRGRARLHGLLGLAPGRDQEGHVRAAAVRLRGVGRAVPARSTRWTSGAPTRRSSASTRSRGRAASPT